MPLPVELPDQGYFVLKENYQNFNNLQFHFVSVCVFDLFIGCGSLQIMYGERGSAI